MKANAVHAALFALLLAGCGASPRPEPQPGPRVAEAPAPVERPSDPVEALLARASRAPDRDAAALRIEAAGIALQAGQGARAAEILGALGPGLDSEQRARAALLRARLALAAQDPAAALAVLTEASQQELGASLPRELEVDMARGRADALVALDRPLDAAREQSALQPWLSGDADRVRNAREILGRLSAVPLAELEHESQQAQSEDWRAWLELSMAARDMRHAPAAQQQRLQEWLQRYAGLAALDGAAAPLAAELRDRIAQPARTAVLLPLSGRASSVGQAVLQGYLAEYYRQLATGETLPPVAVLDTTGTPEGFSAAYQRAVTDGASLVVGPLLKEELAAFTGTLRASVPTIALNFLEGPQATIPGVHQFGIDAGDELSQLAASARAAGFGRAVVLADDSPRAERLVSDFDARWRAQGGTLIGTLVLRDLNDYRDRLERTMLLDRSNERAQALNRLLGLELQTEPRRRGDLDVLFMLAEPVPARSIRSLLSFLYAGDLPVWGTSLSNAGGANPEEDLDLETLRFVDMPWFSDAESALHAEAGGLRGGSERLFALGADACRLQSRLALLDASAGGGGLGGATGELSADAGGRIHRRSEWYVFRQGHARPERARASAAQPPATPSSTEGDAQWTTESSAPPTSDEPPRIAP